MAGHGVLKFTVWPTHAGAVDENGREPLGHRDYQRGQVDWGLNDRGEIVGHVRIIVPAGNWTHCVYTHHPTSPMFVTAQKFSRSFRLPTAGVIDLEGITEQDVRPFEHDRILHD